MRRDDPDETTGPATEEPPGWERAARRFLAPWRRRRDVEGAIACGSFVTGHATPRSDVDLAIVLADGVRWRERGNRRVDGHLIEYFANPPAQLRAYWKSDRASHRRVTATMFVSGRILFDRRGVARALVGEARRWHRKPLPRPDRAAIEAAKYGLWDAVDGVLDALERVAPDAAFRYHHAVQSIYEVYARWLRQPVLPAGRVFDVLGPGGDPSRYRLDAFPDGAFERLLVRAIRERDPARMRVRVERLLRHAHDAMGGFEIDGWRLRMPAVRDDSPPRR